MMKTVQRWTDHIMEYLLSVFLYQAKITTASHNQAGNRPSTLSSVFVPGIPAEACWWESGILLTVTV